MNPVNKALWFIESHFAEALELDDVAHVAGVSRYHLTRAFGAATGQSIMRYMRGRRLTIAGRALANGAPDILAVALEAGYGSHEAFTRAFREQFGVTPETVRAQRQVGNLNIVEAIKMDENMHVNLGAPRIAQGKAMLIAGMNERYGVQSGADIPAQWQRFVPRIGSVPKQVGRTAYGLIFNGDDDGNYDYMCGVEVSDFSQLPNDLDRLRVPACKYAVFHHPGHVSGLRSTWNTVWSKSLPESGYELADAPIFERYGEEFDGRA
ncbi:MAG TPA: AraC family transcriptional regulator, partial [Gammaproteobacteria bacterium]